MGHRVYALSSTLTECGLPKEAIRLRMAQLVLASTF